MESLTSFLIAALALAGSPGPNTLTVAATAAAFGRSKGFQFMLGVNLGMAIVIAMTGFGITGLLIAIPGAAPVIATLAAAYFIYLAYRIATSPPVADNPETGTEPRWYEGVLLSLVNPKGYAAMSAMFSTFTLLPADTVADAVLKATLLMLVIVFVNLSWLFAGVALTRFLKNERSSRMLNVVFAATLIVSVLVTAII